MHASKSIHKLSLILVDSLNLNGKQRVGIDRNSESPFDIICQSDFIIHLDFIEFLYENWIIHFVLKFLEKDGIGEPLVITEGFSEQSGKLRIALQQPSSESDSVGDILELVRAAVKEGE
jgi:hypothetical protein